MSTPKYVIRGKVAVLGDFGSGKTGLVQAFHSEGASFSKSHQMNTTADIVVKSVTIPETDACVELFIYDMPGHEVFQTIVERHAAGASAFVLVYDVTNKDALAGIGKWLKLAGTIRDSAPLVGCLVATKCDIADRRRLVTAQQGQDVAQSLNLEYFECSAATNAEVESPFYYVANALYEAYEEHVKGLQDGQGV
ncbi:hypothetical protein H9P43_005120 [Blastocladiella emersonii ATCC 22665]|nr:hypothetical protein H9P43_005120 [Blastocladiella emersonii ATCC 22665]